MALAPLFPEIKKMAEALPTLGICLGHQLIALAFGGKTEKMKFGHRGANHPVKELETGKVWITSQNHGYEVIADTIDQGTFNIAYKNVNDNSVEGLKHKTLPLQTVQFHPEANAGPNDTAHIFKKFVQQLAETGEMLNA
jgi:carbamoyl-phosphate synthase small subunit